MKLIKGIAFFSLALVGALSLAGSSRAEVWTVPAPQGQGVENAYKVKVDGQDVAIYRSFDQEQGSGEYYFGSFEFTGKVQIEITGPFALDKATVAPDRFGVKIVKQSSEAATLEADKPFQISFEPDGRVKPLILFGLAPETDAPKEGDPNVIYYGPGNHKPDVIKLTDNQTLYIAAGAVVNGGVVACGKNITIRGRGVLAGTMWERFKGPCDHTIYAHDCDNLTIRDLILRDSWSWTCVCVNSKNVTVDGLRICASNMINDDALDLGNVKNAKVTNCFFRSQDDCIAIKGLDNNRRYGITNDNRYPCENIDVEDCVFWTDRANIFRIGYECETSAMRNIRAKNIDVLYYSVDYREPSHYWCNAIIWLQPNQEMLMSNCAFDNFRIRSNKIRGVMLMAKAMQCKYEIHPDPVPGKLENCELSNFTVYGEPGFDGVLHFEGYSEQSYVKNIRIRNFNYYGKKIDANSPLIEIGPFTEGIVIE